MKTLDRKYDRTDGVTYWGYDLGEYTYAGFRYVMTDCKLNGFSDEDAVTKLYTHRGPVHRFKTVQDLFDRLHNKKYKLPLALR